MDRFDSKRVWGPTPRYPNVLAYRAIVHNGPIIIAGPCSVESESQMDQIAAAICRHVPAAIAPPCPFLRGGIYKAGTYPPEKDFGLQAERLAILSKVGRQYRLPVIVEVLDVRDLDFVAPRVDALQIGARHMQDYALLKEASRFEGVVTLKRNMGATLDEFLGAAEYLTRGVCTPVLIERGGSTNLNHVRWDLSLSMIAAIKRMTGMPIIVDASHGTGRRDLVEPMTLAGLAAGADGFLVEVHPKPEESCTDTDQAFPLDRFDVLKERGTLIYRTIRDWNTKDAGHSLTATYAWGQGAPERRKGGNI